MQHLLPSIIVSIIIWSYLLPFWQIKTRPFGKAEPSIILALVALIELQCIYCDKWFILPMVLLFIKQYWQVTPHKSPWKFLSMKCSVKQHNDPCDNNLTHFVLLFLVSLIPARFHCIEHHQQHIRHFLLPPCRPNQFRNIRWGNFILLPGAPRLLHATVQHYTGFINSLPVIFTLICIIQVAIPDMPIFSVQKAFRCTIPITVGWMTVDYFRHRAFNTWVRPPGITFAENADAKVVLCDNLNAATPSCWKFDQDALMISSIYQMNPMAVLWLFWPPDSFCVSCMFWLPCHISEKSWTLAILYNVLSSDSFHFQVVFSYHRILCSVISCRNPNIGLSILPYDPLFTKGPTCDFWLPPAEIISPKGKTGLHSDTMWYDRESIACYISEIGALWVCVILLPPAVRYIQYGRCTANQCGVGVVIIKIRIILRPVLGRMRQEIQIEPGRCEQVCCVITSSGHHRSHILPHSVFFIISGQIIWNKWRSTRARSRCGEEEIVARYTFRFNDGQKCMLGTVFIVHILQKHCLVLGSKRNLVLRNIMHSLVPLPKRLQHPERIKDVCHNVKHTRGWSIWSIMFGHHL